MYLDGEPCYDQGLGLYLQVQPPFPAASWLSRRRGEDKWMNGIHFDGGG
jgi:hypothetical protein